MGYYNSPMHRKSRGMKKYTSQERTARKHELRRGRQSQKDGSRKREPLGGILGFINSLKKQKKGDK